MRFVDFLKFSPTFPIAHLITEQTVTKWVVISCRRETLRSARVCCVAIKTKHIFYLSTVRMRKIFLPIFIYPSAVVCQVGKIISRQDLRDLGRKWTNEGESGACLNIDYENYTNEKIKQHLHTSPYICPSRARNVPAFAHENTRNLFFITFLLRLLFFLAPRVKRNSCF